MADRVPLFELVDRATNPHSRAPDWALIMAICDRVNAVPTSSYEVVRLIRSKLASKQFNEVRLALDLLESCVKNCPMQFHREVGSKDLMDTLTKLLKQRRPKKKISLTSVSALMEVLPVQTLSEKQKELWLQVEDKILYLIQLWADTFMMQEDKLPWFMRTYRELRAEGVQFPPRDKNERFMIRFEGEPSPVFELAEQNLQGTNEARHQHPTAGRSTATSTSTRSLSSSSLSSSSSSHAPSSSAHAYPAAPSSTTRSSDRVRTAGLSQARDATTSQAASGPTSALKHEEVESIRESVTLLLDMLNHPDPDEDIRDNELLADLYSVCKRAQPGLAALITETGDNDRMGMYLALNDDIDAAIEKHRVAWQNARSGSRPVPPLSKPSAASDELLSFDDGLSGSSMPVQLHPTPSAAAGGRIAHTADISTTVHDDFADFFGPVQAQAAPTTQQQQHPPTSISSKPASQPISRLPPPSSSSSSASVPFLPKPPSSTQSIAGAVAAQQHAMTSSVSSNHTIASTAHGVSATNANSRSNSSANLLDGDFDDMFNPRSNSTSSLPAPVAVAQAPLHFSPVMSSTSPPSSFVPAFSQQQFPSQTPQQPHVQPQTQSTIESSLQNMSLHTSPPHQAGSSQPYSLPYQQQQQQQQQQHHQQQQQQYYAMNSSAMMGYPSAYPSQSPYGVQSAPASYPSMPNRAGNHSGYQAHMAHQQATVNPFSQTSNGYSNSYGDNISSSQHPVSASVHPQQQQQQQQQQQNDWDSFLNAASSPPTQAQAHAHPSAAPSPPAQRNPFDDLF